jgi:hypothetical protein
MGLIQKLKSVFVHQERSAQHLSEIVAASANEQRLRNDMLSKLDALVAGSENEQRLLNEKLDATIVLLGNVVKGLDDHVKLSNTKFDALIAGLNSQTRLLNEKLNALIAKSDRPPG